MIPGHILFQMLQLTMPMERADGEGYGEEKYATRTLMERLAEAEVAAQRFMELTGAKDLYAQAEALVERINARQQQTEVIPAQAAVTRLDAFHSEWVLAVLKQGIPEVESQLAASNYADHQRACARLAMRHLVEHIRMAMLRPDDQPGMSKIETVGVVTE